MDPNMMETASSPPNFGSPQSPLEMKPDPNMIAMGQGIVFTRSKMYKRDLNFLDMYVPPRNIDIVPQNL